MKRETISRAVGNLPDALLEEAQRFESAAEARKSGSGSDAKRTGKFRWGIAAACLILLIAVSLSAVYVAAEAEEYREAETFFQDNNLSMEGLTRSEVKAVYRDIVTKSFTNSKTAEVLRTSVPVFELTVSEPAPTPEQLARIWDWNNRGQAATDHTGYYYSISYEEPADTFDEWTSVVTCKRDDAECWTVRFPSCSLEGGIHTVQGTCLWGLDSTPWSQEPPQSADDYPKYRARVIFLDESGAVLSDQLLGNGVKWESVEAVLDNGDGTVAVLSIADWKDLCFAQMQPDGTILQFRKTGIGQARITAAIRFGDGYLISCSKSYSDPEQAQTIIKLTAAGEIDSEFQMKGDGICYRFETLAEIDGQFYLSGYTYPDETDAGGRNEIALLLKPIFESGQVPTEQEMTQLSRENFSAVLLLCSPDGKEPQFFYQVPGAFGGAVTADGEGNVVWEVRDIVTTEISLYTSSHTVSVRCRVLSFTLGENGEVLSEKDTGTGYSFLR